MKVRFFAVLAMALLIMVGQTLAQEKPKEEAKPEVKKEITVLDAQLETLKEQFTEVVKQENDLKAKLYEIAQIKQTLQQQAALIEQEKKKYEPKPEVKK
jgi:chromosome segregation ATPase